MYPLALADDVSIKDSSDDDPVNCQDPNVFTKSLVQGKVIICHDQSDYFENYDIVEIINTIQKVGAAGVILTGRQIDPESAPAFPSTIPSAIFVNEADARVGSNIIMFVNPNSCFDY